MLKLHEIKVSPIAISQARHCGFSNDTENRVRGIAAAATNTFHSMGNKVFGSYVLHMPADTVLSFSMIGPIVVDERPVQECKICKGLMLQTVKRDMNGKYGTATRPCPRAFNREAPLCDTLVKKVNR